MPSNRSESRPTESTRRRFLRRTAAATLIGPALATAGSTTLVGAEPDAKKASSPKAGRYALLVGCTKYPSLPLGMQLRGPANDVVLMRQLLMGRFGFSARQIVTLAERQTRPDRKPTRGNIVREFERLTKVVRQGDRVVILLSGHGSRQPDNDPVNPDDPEPDGFDEIFLPSDIGDWDGDAQRVKNSIVDDEIRGWLDRIRRRGATVWFVADSCHSGTLSRGGSDETARQVPAGQLIPERVMKRARAAAVSKSTSGKTPAGGQTSPAPTGGLVALYAAQPDEPTYEKRLPPDSDKRKPYGLLTYAINEILTRSTAPMSYRQLAQAVHQLYVQWGRAYPTPLLEGADIDREVLGRDTWSGWSRFRLVKDAQGRLTVNAGTLQGVRKESVLRVFSLSGKTPGAQPIGHVRVVSEGTLESVVVPVAFGKVSRTQNLPANAPCEIAYRTYGDFRLQVAVARIDLDGQPISTNERQKLSGVLRELADGKHSFVKPVVSTADAEWVIGLREKNVYLVPPGGLVVDRTRGSERVVAASSPLFGPAPLDARLKDWLGKRLQRIARVRNLMSLADGPGVIAATGADVQLELVRYQSLSDANPQPVRWSNGVTLKTGDIVAFRVKNRGTTPVDVTLLFIGSGYGIEAFVPSSPVYAGVRLNPGKKLLSPRARVTPTAGLEHMMLIATRSRVQEQPANFGWLAQPSLERARAVSSVPPSPLRQLLETSAFAEGQARGLTPVATESQVIRVLSWEVRGGTRKQKRNKS